MWISVGLQLQHRECVVSVPVDNKLIHLIYNNNLNKNRITYLDLHRILNIIEIKTLVCRILFHLSFEGLSPLPEWRFIDADYEYLTQYWKIID